MRENDVREMCIRDRLSGLHWLATLLTGIISNVPGTVTYFNLEMRG